MTTAPMRSRKASTSVALPAEVGDHGFQRFCQLQERGPHQGLAVAEVAVHRHARHPGGVGHLVHGDAPHPPGHQEVAGRRQDPLGGGSLNSGHLIRS